MIECDVGVVRACEGVMNVNNECEKGPDVSLTYFLWGPDVWMLPSLRVSKELLGGFQEIPWQLPKTSVWGF